MEDGKNMQSNNIALYIKRKNRNSFLKSLGASGVILSLAAMILSQVFFPLMAQAANPTFNIFTPYVHTYTYNHDYYLLDVKNETKGTGWNFPVAADANDILVFVLYYHNSENYTTATNTTLKVSMPSAVAAQQIVTGYLWADNATNATPSSPMTQPVQVNISTPQSLTYIANSVLWYPNQKSIGVDQPVSLPSGQTGEQLFTSGINVGSIDGCWEFSGQLIFKARVSNINYAPGLTIDKKMKNLTTNDANWADSINARPRHNLAVQLTVTNTGNAAANNVIVRDNLPDKLIYVNGSTKVDNGAVGDGITGFSGINIGTLNQGQTKTVYFEVNADREVRFLPRGTTNLTNSGFVKADGLSEVQDSALIAVYYNGCAPETGGPASK